MRISVIITTYNRAHALPRVVESVLSQEGVDDLELIIVDDGSTDTTRSYLQQITDPRVTVIHRENGGPCAARNAGMARASGAWIAFLDDDDLALPSWLDGLASLANDRAGAVCCGAEYYTPEGHYVRTVVPVPMGAMFRNLVGNTLAGTFIVRSSILHSIGGYDEQIMSSQQTDLWLRLLPAIIDRGFLIRTTSRVLVHLERRDAHDRSTKSPAALYQGTHLLLTKHRDSYARDPRRLASSYGILGVNAARLGKWSEARSALLRSARAEPRSLRRWLRFATAYCTPIARRIWRVEQYETAAAEVVAP